MSNIEWSQRWSTVNEWLRFREASRRVLSGMLRGWYRWVSENVPEVKGLNPDEMVEYQRRANNSNGVDVSTFFQVYQALQAVDPRLKLDGAKVLAAQRVAIKNGNGLNKYAIIDGVARYILAKRDGWRQSYQRKVLSAVRSFFEANHAELSVSSNEKRSITLTVPAVQEQLTLRDVQRVVNGANEMFRAVFLCMLAGGMGLREILKWNAQGISSLEEAMRNPIRVESQELIKIDFEERKSNSQPYWTLIGGDALDALKTYLRLRERKRAAYEKKRSKAREEIPPYPDTIFVTTMNTPLKSASTIQHYWLRNLNRQAIIKREKGAPHNKRYGKNLHQLRDLFRSQWSIASKRDKKTDNDVAEFLMGHLIDPMGYDQFFNDEHLVAENYAWVLPYLNILSDDTAFGKVDASTLSTQGKQIKELQANVAQLEDLILSLSSGSGDSRYSLQTSGHSRPQMHYYPSNFLGQLQQAIRNGEDLKVIFDTKTGKWRWIAGHVIKL